MLYLTAITALLAAIITPAHAIVNGTTVTRDAYQYTVALLQPGLAGARQPFICNGILLTEYSVLTSAECVQGLSSNEVAVRVGFNNTGGYQTISVNDIATMSFNASTLANDAAILNLTTAVTNITPASLSPTVANVTTPTGPLKIVGWGGHVFNNSQTGYQSLSPTLQVATVQAYNTTYCQAALSSCDFHLDDTQRFCTSSSPKGAAGYGDAGGAVVDAMGLVVGIMTGNPACAQPEGVAVDFMLSGAGVGKFIAENSFGPT